MARYGNVLQLADYGAPYEGNFIASLKTLEQRLETEGRGMFYVFPLRAKETAWVTQLEKVRGNVGFLPKTGFFATVRILRGLLSQHDVGTLHVHFYHYREKLAALLACRTMGRRVRYVCHLHNHLHVPRSFFRALPHRLLFSLADAFVCCSRSVAECAISDGLNKSKVYLAENAIDFSRLDAYVPADRAALGIREDERTALMFGFDFARKGVDLAVSAIGMLRAGGLPVKLAVSLSSRREAVEQAICAALGTEGLPDWILPLPPRNDVAAYYHMADVFLSPSREEGFCYSLIEAAYCLCPVVASAIDAQRDLALPADAFFTPGDANDLAARIEAALQSRDEAVLAARRTRVVDTYRLDRWADAVLLAYGAPGSPSA